MERAKREMGLSPAEAERLGPEKAAKIRIFRHLHHLGQRIRFLADSLYWDDGLTAQQAMMLSVVDLLGRPSLTEVADVLTTSHQNVKQIARALERKGHLTIKPSPNDARVRQLATTPKNKRYWLARDRSDFDVVVTWFDALSQADAERLEELLFGLHESVGRAVNAIRERRSESGPGARGSRRRRAT